MYYTIVVRTTVETVLNIEADSQEEAEDIAKVYPADELLENGEIQNVEVCDVLEDEEDC